MIETFNSASDLADKQATLREFASLAVGWKIKSTAAPFYAYGRYLNDLTTGRSFAVSTNYFDRRPEPQHPENRIDNYRVGGLHPQDALNVAIDELREAARAIDTKTTKKKRGAPVRFDPRDDARVFEAWATGDHKTHADCARELGGKHTAESVKLTIERHAKRMKQQARSRK